MTARPRREFLALSLGAFGSIAGCVAGTDETPASSPAPPEAASLSFNHAEPLHRVDAAFPQRDVASYYLAVVTSPDHATTFPTDRFNNQEAVTFVSDTDYSQAAVIILQDRQSSSHPDLELRRDDIEGDTITIDAGYPGDGRTADITTDTLLVRVASDKSDVRRARATIRRQHGDPDRIATRNVYDDVPTFDAPGDLILQNRDCSNIPVSGTVTYEGDLFFRDRLDLPPASRRRVDSLFSYAGEWTVAVRTGGDPVEQSWSLTRGTPGDVLVDVADDGTVSLSHHANGVDATDPAACETTDYPYESADPAENLDRPVDLWILDQSDREHHLTVTIRDGDTEVFSDEFTTEAGDDKAQRAGLLAKKTTYTVLVTMDDEPTVSTSVPVREGVKKLEIRISESEELSISAR